MLVGLQDKVVLCAGSGTGIGAETALRLACEGARVAVADVNIAAARAVVEKIAAQGGEGLAVEFDITEEESVRAMVAGTVARFGGLDAMHINATDRKRNREDLDLLGTGLDVFDRVHAVSLRGHLVCSRIGLPEMIRRGGGAIVYTSSDAAKQADDSRMSYGIAKAGLNALMRHVAHRYGRDGIRANTVCPGLIMTDALIENTSEEERAQLAAKIPNRRAGTPRDVAGLVAFLMSDDAIHLNGQAISLNGGTIVAVG